MYTALLHDISDHKNGNNI